MKTKNEPDTVKLPLNVAQTSSICCSITNDGAAIYNLPEKKAAPSSCGCSSTIGETAESPTSVNPQKRTLLRNKVRSGVLFVVACIASPCCTPLYVPLLLLLLAGTPAAVWLSANIGLVYGALTIFSIISLVLAIRLWPRAKAKFQSKTHDSKQLSAQANSRNVQ